uniref:tyrosine-protein kinase Src42A-like n=1 Tax=Pristiophorus japonicus TaxID=55135 RepID=UPI00398F69A1
MEGSFERRRAKPFSEEANEALVNVVSTRIWSDIADVVTSASNETRTPDQYCKRWNSLLAAARSQTARETLEAIQQQTATTNALRHALLAGHGVAPQVVVSARSDTLSTQASMEGTVPPDSERFGTSEMLYYFSGQLRVSHIAVVRSRIEARPDIIVSDNRPCFTSLEFQEFMKRNAMKHVSYPSNPNSTLEDEERVRTLGFTYQTTNESSGAALCSREARPLGVPGTSTVQQSAQNSCRGAANPGIKKEDKELCKSEVPHCSEIYIVQFDYMARTHEELSVRKGEHLEILSKEGDWWLAQKVSKGSRKSYKYKKYCSGFVPVELLAKGKSLEGEPWYCGKMSRFETENHLLSSSQKVGLFLVRKSETLQDSYVLSTNVGGSVVHYVILEKENGRLHITGDPDFATIHELVEHYKHNVIYCGIKLNRSSKKKKPTLRHLSYNTVDKWERPKEEFTLVKCIGSGNYGEVWKATWNDNVPVAIKMLKADTTDSSNFLKEAQIMKNFQHQNLIPLYAVCTRKQPLFIVTELMKHGDLLKYLRRFEGCFTIAQLIDMAVQVAAGMSYLESKHYIHLDLAARNILVGNNIICKISDFGLAKLLKGVTVAEIPNSQFPIKWTAPEVAITNQVSMKSDVWSFGIVLFEITTYGKVPYPGMSNRMALLEVVQGYRMPCPHGCPQPIYNIMRECWNEVPSQRPLFSTLKLQLEDIIITNFNPLY